MCLLVTSACHLFPVATILYLVSEIGKAGADLPVDFRFGVCSEIRLLLFGPETRLLHPLQEVDLCKYLDK